MEPEVCHRLFKLAYKCCCETRDQAQLHVLFCFLFSCKFKDHDPQKQEQNMEVERKELTVFRI